MRGGEHLLTHPTMKLGTKEGALGVTGGQLYLNFDFGHVPHQGGHNFPRGMSELR